MNYRDFKEKISIVQVAESIGYVRNKSKGNRKDKGQVFERSFTEGGLPRKDRIVVNYLMGETAGQKYFNQDASLGFEDRGDVINFVLKRLHLFGETLNPDHPTETLSRIFSRFTQTNFLLSSWVEEQKFNEKDYCFSVTDWTIQNSTIKDLAYLSGERKISCETLRLFLPFIYRVSFSKWRKGNHNIGFPFTIPGSDEIVGFELKNHGFKKNAPGTNKLEGCWCACFSHPYNVTDVYLFESTIDALSYFDLFKREILPENGAFVSLGGALSKGQLKNLLGAFPAAKFNSGFDNDFNGHLYDIQAACILMNKTYSFARNGGTIICTLDGTNYPIRLADFNMAGFRRITGLRPNLKAIKPAGAKDFNEILTKRKKELYYVPESTTEPKSTHC